MFHGRDGPGALPAILHDVAKDALRENRALTPGDVVGPRGQLRSGAAVSALYVSLPVYLPDSFHVCRSTADPVVFAWLIPITNGESEFIRAQGARAFEALLESSDPDLLDFQRAGVA